MHLRKKNGILNMNCDFIGQKTMRYIISGKEQTMSEVCMFFGTGYEEVEALAVIDILRRAEVDVSMVSITGERKVTGSHNITVEMDCLIEEVDFDRTKMILLPGGMPGTINLEKCDLLMTQLERFYEQKKAIGAICAAPSILGHKSMLKGRNACSYPTFESHLEGAKVSKNPCEISDFIITARGMGCAIDFGLAVLSYLRGQEEADKAAEGIVYRR